MPQSPYKNEDKFERVVRELKLHHHFNEEVDFQIRFLKLCLLDLKNCKNHKKIY